MATDLPAGAWQGGKGKREPKPKKPKRRTLLRLPQKPFRRLIREIMFEISPMVDVRMEPKVNVVVQQVTEAYLSRLLEDANKCAVHAKRLTLQKTDIALAHGMVHASFVTEMHRQLALRVAPNPLVSRELGMYPCDIA